MQCYECGTTTRTARPALAVCDECGAATCADHTHESRTQVRSSTLGNPVVRTARRLRCSECTRLAEQPEPVSR
ncbi:MAG TPA: DUF2180 family protein [Isoptericola sp.]|nr:DUF2180 family protein [Isoptericola sp.]